MSVSAVLDNEFGTPNYQPFPVVLTHGKGPYVFDQQGKRYLDMASAVAVLSLGHCHPRLVETLTRQAQKLTMTSRLFYNESLGPLLQLACCLTKQARALPMNSGAEAVETAIKAARKWGYTQKNIAEDEAEILVCQNNFHGRTITMVSLSSEPKYKNNFGPLTPGFKLIPFDDPIALEQAITPRTVAFLLEPIQGEAGVQVPAAGYLQQCQQICREQNVLFILDEIQTGLGRTGKLLASEHEDVIPDGLLLGKALGGGLLPISLFLGNEKLMTVFQPGEHGSTFGGNPLAAAVAHEALTLLSDEALLNNVQQLGSYFIKQLQQIKSPLIKQIRGQGLMIGLELNTEFIASRQVCLKLLAEGLLCIDTRRTTLRLLPPLIVTEQQIDEAITIITKVLYDFERQI